MKNWKEINERREGYIRKRNNQNMQIDTLTEEQHEAIQYVCSARHNLHVNSEDMFFPEHVSYDDMWGYLDDSNDSSINAVLSKAGLPTIDFSSIDTCTPNADDWKYFLSESERGEWEDKAEQIASDIHTGYSLWLEEGEERQIFNREIKKINPLIEAYLNEIDKEYGTDYCPSGTQRLY